MTAGSNGLNWASAVAIEHRLVFLHYQCKMFDALALRPRATVEPLPPRRGTSSLGRRSWCGDRPATRPSGRSWTRLCRRGGATAPSANWRTRRTIIPHPSRPPVRIALRVVGTLAILAVVIPVGALGALRLQYAGTPPSDAVT